MLDGPNDGIAFSCSFISFLYIYIYIADVVDGAPYSCHCGSGGSGLLNNSTKRGKNHSVSFFCFVLFYLFQVGAVVCLRSSLNERRIPCIRNNSYVSL